MADELVPAGEEPLRLPSRSTSAFPRAAARLRTAAPSPESLAVLDAFLVLGLLGVYLKVALMAPQWGAVARFLGRNPGEPLGLLEQLGFFGSDLLLNLVAVPLAAATAFAALGRRLRVGLASAATVLLSLAYFVELRAGSEVGQYISGEVVRDFIGWGFANPASAADYITPASLVKLAALLGTLATIALVARAARGSARPRVRRRCRLLLGAPAAIVVAAAAALAAVAFAVRLPQSPLNASAVGLAVEALVTTPDPVAASAWGSLDDALASLRQLTHTAAYDRHHVLAGRERDADLLLFMMETGPAQALDLAASAGELPGARRLIDRAFVSPQHYSAHPYSSDALFAVLSGTYPHGRTRLLRDLGGRELTGLFSGLPPDVGLRGVYLPSLYQIELDDSMYRTFGARTLYVADRHPDDPLKAHAEIRADALVRRIEAGGRLDATTRARLRERLVMDLQALERVKADVRRAIAGGGRYAVMFFPEVGHGPWPQLRDADDDVLARGRLLMELQDEWLGELLDLVTAAGRLERTVVAVTADHGLRTRAEYPPLKVGFISDVMFRVPLLIYAPRTLSGPMTVAAPTSHVDLAPTLLALLGGDDAAARMHGVPIWQRTPRDRLYLLGAAYGGADGFLEDGRFHMRQALSGAVYVNDRFAFDDTHQVTPDDPFVPSVTSGLARASEAQHAVTTRLRER